jgi:hypothetical protein
MIFRLLMISPLMSIHAHTHLEKQKEERKKRRDNIKKLTQNKKSKL